MFVALPFILSRSHSEVRPRGVASRVFPRGGEPVAARHAVPQLVGRGHSSPARLHGEEQMRTAFPRREARDESVPSVSKSVAYESWDYNL